MSTGSAPLLMLDLAASQMRDRQRSARDRAQTSLAQRARAARRAARR
ncbi:hypothetical protein [Nocardioides mesophilus]|uniref:Uncharacterized protein n=1 Tax=Nocardioides mesophilus TaxID=433659 RepID=A0A7G9R7A4_9ACTN|nr:hypothetical protein [Nocardioides mesophilus]QNN51479.1 hypothetical protein H9L09_12830 [Nocardioides mesophilus]